MKMISKMGCVRKYLNYSMDNISVMTAGSRIVKRF